MKPIIVLSAAEQVAAHIRAELLTESFQGHLPGVNPLAKQLGVNHKTVKSALTTLENEGLLASQGQGCKRRVIAHGKRKIRTALRVGILLNETADRMNGYIVELQHRLAIAGHVPFFAPQSLMDLGMDVGRVARMVKNNSADAWVVVSGSNEVMKWFTSKSLKTFALLGRQRELPIAGGGPNKPPAMAEATRSLIQLGHQRIVLLARKARRLPHPGASEQAFLSELEAHGINTSSYHLPDWEMTVDGFFQCLSSLFELTRPTALIIDEAPLYVAVQQFLTKRRLRVPQDVSLVCTDPNPVFAWCKSPVAHIHWDSDSLVQRILQWANNVSRGKADLRQIFIPATFVSGGTIRAVKS